MKNNKKEKKREKENLDKRNKTDNYGHSGVRNETKQSISMIVFFILAFFLLLAAFDKAGVVGRGLYNFFHILFGVGYYLLPITFILLGIAFSRSFERRFPILKIVSGAIIFSSGLGLVEVASNGSGGKVGNLLAKVLVSLFDVYTTVALLFALTVIGFLILFDTHLKSDLLLFWRKKKDIDDEEDEDLEPVNKKIKLSDISPAENIRAETKEVEQEKDSTSIFAKKPNPKPEEKTDDDFITKGNPILYNREYAPPPLSLLENDKGKPGVGDIQANANIIKRTLQNFGIIVEMDEVTIGPTVTRYSLKPAEGVKLSKIVGLQDNLALALAAQTIRIEAPIPGKSLVGIEVPNSTKTIVGLGTLVGSKEFQSSEKPLLTSIGKNVAGKGVYYDLAKMPHLLIAGTTGSGKSVTVHAILTSLLFRNSPDILKFIMVDAKRVELTLYNKIPHLLTPVITDAKKTILALKWAAKEMDRRYDVLERESVRDIHSYHKNIVEPAIKSVKDKEPTALPEIMPYIVIVIDELADLMQAYPRELESSIVRLAQMSRAVGIHLILSTQRPSVNVITGLIKANIPTRIALKVGSQIDSRTILDRAGAEKLVGQGDMLFSSQDNPEPVRIQSPFISESEVKKVVKHLVDSYQDEIPQLDIAGTEQKEGVGDSNPIFSDSVLSDEASGDDDELYEEARQIVVQAGKASTSYIQRKLRVGYARAARLMDILEEKGVIGPADGSKPREVYGAESNAVPTDENI